MKEKREERISEYLELEEKKSELEKKVNSLLKGLRLEVCGRNECIHLVGQIPQYDNSCRPACQINMMGERGTNEEYNWVSPYDCALCSSYAKNPDVKKSIFTGLVYKRGEPCV